MAVEDSAHYHRREQCQSQQFIDGALIESLLASNVRSALDDALVDEPLPVKRLG